MTNSTQVFLDFCDQLFSTSNVDEMFLALEKAAHFLGFDNVSYTFVPGAISHSQDIIAPIFKISKAYNSKFIQHYCDSGFGKEDFTIKRIIGGDLSPMIWWQEANDKKISKPELEVIAVARNEYGIHHGISLPTYTDGYNIAGVSVTREYADDQFDHLCKERCEYLRRMSLMFSDRVLCKSDGRAMFMQPFLQTLSCTEKKVLAKLAEGQNVKSVSHELELDYKYVANTVVKSLRKKFGDVTRDALMYEAGMLNFAFLLGEK